MPNLTIYYDSLIELEWFKNLNACFSKANIKLIKNKGENEKDIEDLLIYDKPDIILKNNKEIVLVVEKTNEVNTGHNVLQRVARLVRAIECNVPVIYFFPYNAKKHGEYSNMTYLNPRILLAIEKMWQIHDIPIMAIELKTDSDGEIINDGTEDSEIKEVISSYVISSFDTNNVSFKKIREANIETYNERISVWPQGLKPPKSVYEVDTFKFLSGVKNDLIEESHNKVILKKKSIVYQMNMNESACRRQDPYTGAQFAYDYIYCREGKLPHQKKKNLFLYFPLIRKDTFISNNPNDISRKSCNWYLIANCLIFSDGILFIR